MAALGAGWKPLALGDGGAVEGEIETATMSGVRVYEGGTKSDEGVLRLSTHRLMWHHASGTTAHQLYLVDVRSLKVDGGRGFLHSPKIAVSLAASEFQLSFSCSTKERDAFLQKMQTSVTGKAWERQSAPPAAPAAIVPEKKEFSTAHAGVAGIMRQTEQRARNTDLSMQQAFADLDGLMEKAKEMVQLAERVTALQAKALTGNEKEEAEFREYLLQVGIAAPVTKKNAGSLYHVELSRQLSNWLLVRPLKDAGGMLALTDLYCLFNRARGTEMISPDDLYRACVLFEDLLLPVRLRMFESGVLVVQSVELTGESIAKSMAAFANASGSCSAFDVARDRKIPMAMAAEQLLEAERLGALCRDETIEGLLFFSNQFPLFCSQLAGAA